MASPVSKITQVVALAALVTIPQAVFAFQGKRNTQAFPVNDTVFEVIARTAGSSNDYWCGAADFAHRSLGADWASDITIVRGRGPSETTGRRTAVQFRLGSSQSEGGFLQAGGLKAGDSMSVQRAFQSCYVPPARF